MLMQHTAFHRATGASGSHANLIHEEVELRVCILRRLQLFLDHAADMIIELLRHQRHARTRAGNHDNLSKIQNSCFFTRRNYNVSFNRICRVSKYELLTTHELSDFRMPN